jgi:hypothetical protein
MSKYAYVCLLAVTCAAFVGCKSIPQQSGVEGTPTEPPHFTFRFLEKTHPEEKQPAPKVEAAKTRTDMTRESANKWVPSQPSAVKSRTLPADTTRDCGIVSVATAQGGLKQAFYEVRGESAGAKPPLITPRLATPTQKSTPPGKTVAKANGATPASAPEQASGQIQGLWYAFAPIFSALCAYVLAPLFVDYLKQRLEGGRRRAKKAPAPAA